MLALTTLLVSAADHWTTYLCLHGSTPGWDVWEVNPIASWLFGSIGLVPGLLLDSAITLVAVGFLLVTRTVPAGLKRAFFAIVIGVTSFAVANNLAAIRALGMSPLGA